MQPLIWFELRVRISFSTKASWACPHPKAVVDGHPVIHLPLPFLNFSGKLLLSEGDSKTKQRELLELRGSCERLNQIVLCPEPHYLQPFLIIFFCTDSLNTRRKHVLHIDFLPAGGRVRYRQRASRSTGPLRRLRGRWQEEPNEGKLL